MKNYLTLIVIFISTLMFSCGNKQKNDNQPVKESVEIEEEQESPQVAYAKKQAEKFKSDNPSSMILCEVINDEIQKLYFQVKGDEFQGTNSEGSTVYLQDNDLGALDLSDGKFEDFTYFSDMGTELGFSEDGSEHIFIDKIIEYQLIGDRLYVVSMETMDNIKTLFYFDIHTDRPHRVKDGKNVSLSDVQ